MSAGGHRGFESPLLRKRKRECPQKEKKRLESFFFLFADVHENALQGCRRQGVGHSAWIFDLILKINLHMSQKFTTFAPENDEISLTP